MQATRHESDADVWITPPPRPLDDRKRDSLRPKSRAHQSIATTSSSVQAGAHGQLNAGELTALTIMSAIIDSGVALAGK